MHRLTKKDLLKLEDYYYWGGYRDWVPFSEELKSKLLEVYGEDPFPYTWPEQDIISKIKKNYNRLFPINIKVIRERPKNP